MTETIRQTHSKDTFLYCISRMFERAAYYGIRAILVLYLIEGSIKMERSEALEFYAIFTFTFLLSGILGAVIGDLLIGNKLSIIIGLLLQTLGTFSLCLTSINGVYLGLSLITLGGGLYSPNIISNFGKLYFHKLKLLDAGYMIFYLAVNLGFFFGVLLIGYLYDNYSSSASFICSGILMFVSIIPLFFLKEKRITHSISTKLKTKQRVTIIAVAFLFIGLFWLFLNTSYIEYHHIELDFRMNKTLGISPSLWSTIDSASYIPIALFAAILWSYFYRSQIFKLLIACVSGGLSFIVLLLIPETLGKEHLALFLISMLLLRISEAHITPLVHSVLAKYANPKYLAILISLAFFPTQIFYFISTFFNGYLYSAPTLTLLIGISGMIILSIVLIWNKRIIKLPTTTNKRH